MKDEEFETNARLWEYTGDGSWHFVSINKKLSSYIRNNYSFYKRGFGSLPVEVQMGDTIWKTSIFPDSKTKTYLLPIKKKVRINESLKKSNNVGFRFKILIDE